MPHRHLLGLILLLVLAVPPAAESAGFGHGSMSSRISELAAREAGGWSGGILASEGAKRITAPISNAVSSGLASFLPPGLARTTAKVLGELVTGAAFKVGMDVGDDLAAGRAIQKPDWLEVGAAAAGMVIGGAVLRPFLGTFGDAIGGWIGWSLAENLVRQYRKGEGLDVVKAFGAIDVPRLALQAVSAEGALVLAKPLVQRVLGLSGPLGVVAGIGLQIALTAGASYVANRIADGLFGKRAEDEPLTDLPALERSAQEAYRKFVEASRSNGADVSRAFAAYRDARARLDAARASAR
jgi:hypothetical protein